MIESSSLYNIRYRAKTFSAQCGSLIFHSEALRASYTLYSTVLRS